MTKPEANDFNVQISIAGDWENVERMRHAVQCFSEALFTDSRLGDAITMVSAELLENAVKYSRKVPGIRPRIQYGLVGGEDRVVVSVANPTSPDGGDAKALISNIRWLRDLGDPADAYAQRMREVFEGRVSDGGLGLVRIAYEGGCELDWSVVDGCRVEVRAIFSRREVGVRRPISAVPAM